MTEYEKAFGERYLSEKPLGLFDDAYDFFSQEISKNFLEEYDVIEIILEVSGAQESINDFDKVIKFSNMLRLKQPALYDEAFVYLADAIIDYYCFTGKSEDAKAFYEDFKANPLVDVDKYLLVFRQALYYGLTDVVESFVTKNYAEILASDKVMPNTALDLAKAKLYLTFEEVYNNRENAIDKAWLTEQLSAYGFSPCDSIIVEFEKAISQPWSDTSFFSSLTGLEQNLFLLNLELYFLQWMAKKGFPFYISGGIWGNLLECWSDANTKANTLADFVVLNFKPYKSHIDDLLSCFFNDNTVEGAATLWGSVYIYDFLLEMGIITPDAHAKYCGCIQDVKSSFVGKSTFRLWAVNFVHKWEKPDSLSDEEFAVEQQIFEKSYSIDEHQFSKIEPFIADELECLGQYGADIIKAGIQSDQLVEKITNQTLDEMSLMDKLLSFEDAQSTVENERNIFDDALFTPMLEKRVGRNEPCPCASGKKYKKCCGKN